MAKRLKILRTKMNQNSNAKNIKNKEEALSLFAKEIGRKKDYFSIALLNIHGNLISNITSSMDNFGEKKRGILKEMILTGGLACIIAFSSSREDIKNINFEKEVNEIGKDLGLNILEVFLSSEFDSEYKDIWYEKLRGINIKNKGKEISEPEAFGMGNMFTETEKYLSMNERKVDDAVLALAKDIQNLDREVLYTICLDKNNKPMSANLVSVGQVHATCVSAINTFKIPVLTGAEKIILMHNHPGGSPSPSEEDIKRTIELLQVGRKIGIEVYDHYIASNNKECVLGKNVKSIKNECEDSGYRLGVMKEPMIKERIFKMGKEIKEPAFGSYEWVQMRKEAIRQDAMAEIAKRSSDLNKNAEKGVEKEKAERVYINLPKAFCKQMDSKLREGEKFNTMIMPKGLMLNGKDIGNCLINPIYMSENPYNKNEMSATYYPAGIKNEGIKLTHPDGRKEFVDIEELRDAIIEHQKEYRASLKKETGKEIKEKEVSKEKEL